MLYKMNEADISSIPIISIIKSSDLRQLSKFEVTAVRLFKQVLLVSRPRIFAPTMLYSTILDL